MKALEFQAVAKAFGAKTVLTDLTFSIEPGEIYGLLGPNGCGKSTASHILCNLLDPDAGQVKIAGQPVGPATRAQLGVCPQEIALYRDLRPAENLRFAAGLYGLHGRAADRRIAELMELFGLTPYAKVPVAKLSGGWQRRVNIAVALVHSPALCVLDEPTAALDVEARHDLWQVIEALRDQKMAVLLTTHHLDEAERLCDTIGIMAGGRIGCQGSAAELIQTVPAQMIAAVETTDLPALAERCQNLGWPLRTYANRPSILLPEAHSLKDFIDRLALDLLSVSLQPVRLEHAYLEILAGLK